MTGNVPKFPPSHAHLFRHLKESKVVSTGPTTLKSQTGRHWFQRVSWFKTLKTMNCL